MFIFVENDEIEAVSKWARETLRQSDPFDAVTEAKEIQNKMQEVLEVPKCQKRNI